MSDGLSLQQRVQKARETREGNVEVRVPIPGYDSLLVGVYGAVDWRTKGEIELRYQDEPDIDRIWQQQADYLVAASKTVEAVDDGETVDLEMPLGRELAEWAGVDCDGDTDKQAVMQFFPDGGALISHAVRVLEETAGAQTAAVEKTMGESVAAS